MARPGAKPANTHVVFWRGRPPSGALVTRTSRITGTSAPAVFEAFAASVAVIGIRVGRIVLTAGAETEAAMLPAASATVLPDTPPPIDTTAPAVKPDPVIGIGRLPA